MRMHSKALGLVWTICTALSAKADKAHDTFEANKDVILSRPVTVCGETAFAVGRARSSRNLGSAVGYAKAEEVAKWNIGDKYRAVAKWPTDILESEKAKAWLEYRCLHPERFTLTGMQRIWTKKTQPDTYIVVIGFPAVAINIPEPTTAELKKSLDIVRERKRRTLAAKTRINSENNDSSEAKDSPDAMEQCGIASPRVPVGQPRESSSQDDKNKDKKITKTDSLNEDLML